MRNKGYLKNDGQNGEIMLEASFVLVSVIIILMVMLSLSFMFYQMALTNSVANELATYIAENYKFDCNIRVDAPLNTELITKTAYEDSKMRMYRTTFGLSKIEDDHSDRITYYAKERINLATLGINPGDVNVSCKLISHVAGRSYVEVTVAQETDFFLSGILDMVGISEESTLFSSVAYAECLDLTAYTSTVSFADYVFGEFKFGNDLVKIGSNIVKIMKSLQELTS